MLKSYFIPLLLLFFSTATIAQTFSISGFVKDGKETLPGATIYVARTNIATVTNDQGRFDIKNLTPGNYDVLVQMLGYAPLSKGVTITNQSVDIEIILSESTSQLKDVVISAPGNRKYLLNLFKENFLGTTANSYKCRLLNPEVIHFAYDKKAGKLKASASDYLLIENRALGYNIKYLLNDFEFDEKTKVVFFQGLPVFQEMQGSAGKKQRWMLARNIAYKGSLVHFFRSLYRNTTEKEGFVINKIKEDPEGGGYAVLDRTNISADTLLHKKTSYTKSISFTGKLFVVYTLDEPERYFRDSEYQITIPDDLQYSQVSIITLMAPEIVFFSNSTFQTNKAALFSGYWAYKKLADYVPIDYAVK